MGLDIRLQVRRPRLWLLCLGVFAGLSAAALASGIDSDPVDFVPHIIRGNDTGGPGEFEFLPEGKLLEYTFGEWGFPWSRESPNERTVIPILSVMRLRWKLEETRLKFGGEDELLSFSYRKDEGVFHAFEHTFTPAKAVVFYEALRRICSDSVLHGAGAGAGVEREAANEKLGKLYNEILDAAGEWARGGRTKGPGAFPRPPFHFIHTDTTEGFVEYEFLPGGKLIAYYDAEFIPAARKYWDCRDSFKVELLSWNKAAGEIVVNHGNGGNEVFKITAGGKGTYSGRGVWCPVEHLLFIPRLFAFCDRPISK